MSGTPSQIEWAERIQPQVSAEFDRVAAAFRQVADRQGANEQARARTLAVIGILEEKRKETLAHDEAGYYIQHWQELNDQVRLLIFQDPRYQRLAQAKRGSTWHQST